MRGKKCAWQICYILLYFGIKIKKIIPAAHHHHHIPPQFQLSHQLLGQWSLPGLTQLGIFPIQAADGTTTRMLYK